MTDEILTATDVRVHYPIKGGTIFDRTVGHIRAVDGVSLSLRRGETYGLVGESGCGKSTLGRALLRLEPLTSGEVKFNGTDLSLLRGEKLRALRSHFQMVFQDPLASLDPRQPVRSILFEGMRAHGMYARIEDAIPELERLLKAVGLPTRALAQYPHEFSGGQRQRIGIARALSVGPELIVADEPVSALDVSIQAQVINLLQDVQEELGLTMLVIAHDLAVVKHISDRVGVMYLGSLVEEAEVAELYSEPLHPYTRVLLSAVPVPSPEIEDTRERIILKGDVPSPANPPSGCRFHTRCPWHQQARCSTEVPELRTVTVLGNPAPRRVACHFAEAIAEGKILPSSGAAAVIVPESSGAENE